ncbi:MAG: peptide-methionine (S)-S-oxide reductase MsrA [Alistipes sp.]|jgi:peptide methionine sulfoxide reductase msrA/msrB|nr:peptide-methionine (S)-S-oxide reductase MsrA [Alistipes sp.]
MKQVNNTETAIFAGGCFWGVEDRMRNVPGVISAESGYIGGHLENPTYEQVKSGTTGHAEAVRVTFDPRLVSYEWLTKYFFEIHDPTQIDRQGADVGPQYRSEIFYLSAEQRQIAERIIAYLVKRGCRVVTRLTPASEFYMAEEYHQRHAEKTGEAPCHSYVKRF